MRENRPYGSEGGEAKSLPYPYHADGIRQGRRMGGALANPIIYPAASDGFRKGSTHPTKKASSSTHTFPQPFDCGLDAAFAVRNVERVEADFDDAEGAQNHRCVDVTHMGDPERLAGQFADADAEHHAAFLLAIAMQRHRVVAVAHHHRRDRVGALAWFRDIEAEHLAFGPDRDRAPH